MSFALQELDRTKRPTPPRSVLTDGSQPPNRRLLVGFRSKLAEYASPYYTRLVKAIPISIKQRWTKLTPTVLAAFTWSERPVALLVIAGGLFVLTIAQQMDLSWGSSATVGDTYTAALSSDDTQRPVSDDPTEPETAASDSPSITPVAFNLKAGEGFVDFLQRAGVRKQEAYRWALRLDDQIDMRRLRVGSRFDMAISPTGSLNELRYRTGFDQLLIAKQQDGKKTVEVLTLPSETKLTAVEGRIDSNLYTAAGAAGLSDWMISSVAEVLAFDVDFQRDLRPGDVFTVYYEQQIVSGLDVDDPTTLLKDKKPLYVMLTSNKKPVEATWFEETGGRPGYFGTDGRSTRKALMKTPVDGARLSSRFGKRKHPVLGYTRMHKGVDFAAPRGTPIKAAGDGTVEFIGRNGGFGNYVKLRHGGSYHTSYAHLTRFARGLKKGSKVQQGQVIGTVGSTGLATGPHLHYEVLRNGKQVDPNKLKLPEAQRLEGEMLDAFYAHRSRLLQDIAAYVGPSRLAGITDALPGS